MTIKPMNSEMPLTRLVDALTEGCPLCQNGPTPVKVLGPDAILLENCGNVVDAMEWAEEAHHLKELNECDEEEHHG